ncbi:MAG: hypothetical protein F6K42_33555, partial [Leptolyngbya sp. SIO1D8]|nr:hypothetical protein [Leptolyngbya sp. SIO1D8]
TSPGVSIGVLWASDRLNCRRVLRDEPRRCVGVPILVNPKSFCCWIPWVAFLDPRYGGLIINTVSQIQNRKSKI